MINKVMNKELKTATTQAGWLQKPLPSHRTLRTAHPHWNAHELHQAILMLDLKQDNPCGDLGVILA